MPATHAVANEIKGGQITPSTSMPGHPNYPLSAIVDGVTADGPVNFNGYVALGQQAGAIKLTFDNPYTLNGFKLWNDVNVRKEGVKSFSLELFDQNGNFITLLGPFATQIGKVDANVYEFAPTANVKSVQLIVHSVFTETAIRRIEIRELSFTTPGSPRGGLIPGAIVAVVGIGGILLTALKRKPAPSPGGPVAGGETTARRRWNAPLVLKTGEPLPKPERPPESGVVFANSPMVASAPAPLAMKMRTVPSTPTPSTPPPPTLTPAGHMVPAGLQTLTGPFAAIRPVYRATGRIGGPQIGVPTNDDVAFGTGFLITPNHVMTNQHVYEFYKHYLTGPDCGGIEFIAEHGRDASEYVAFNGEDPLIVPELDIAIFTLQRSVENRPPIDRISVPSEQLHERSILTISYPCPWDVTPDILALVEEGPVFAVKRISQGEIFRHSTDTADPYGVEVNVDQTINPAGSMPAICHNASTLGGSSGAPLVDMDGNLVGMHFAGDRLFNEREAANLAMAIEHLANIDPTNDGPNKTA